MDGVKSGCFGVLNPGRLDLSRKANKCSDAGTRDLVVPTTHETSPYFSLGDVGSTRLKYHYKSESLAAKC